MSGGLEQVSVSDLVPYVNNAKTHPEEQVLKIASSIKEFGFNAPILVDGNNGIIAGHGRLQAAKKLNLSTVPVVRLDHLSEAQKKAYILADNRLGEVGGTDWDMDLVSLELQDLQDLDFDIDLTGFDSDIIIGGEEVGLPDLADGDKEPFQQKTFTLHDEQASVVDDAVTLARTNPLSDTGLNENSNGNALSLICSQWLEQVNG